MSRKNPAPVLTLATLVAVSFFSLNLTQAHSKKHHHHQKAHVHGAAKMAVAFEGLQGKLEFEAPSESIYGFEHEAKTEKQKKAVADALLKLEQKMPEMVVFATSLGCSWTKNKIEVVREDGDSKHSDVKAEFSLACQQSPLNSEVKLQFSAHFPKLKSVETQWIVDQIQKSTKTRKAGETLVLQ